MRLSQIFLPFWDIIDHFKLCFSSIEYHFGLSDIRSRREAFAKTLGIWAVWFGADCFGDLFVGE